MTGSGRPRRFASERLREARVALGLSQEDAARALSVDVRTYRRYESGAVNAGGPFTVRHASRRALLERMTRELGLSPEELFDDPQTTGTAQSEQGGAGHALPPVARFVGRAALIDDLAQ